jgi:4-amino-4-deoxy-L-arabinose transferase-like glycosyltransferase
MAAAPSDEREESATAGWPYPFAEPGRPGLSRRHWAALVLAFAALHYGALGAAVWIGNFDPDPNHDHVHVMRHVLENGYPGTAVWPPGYGYYLAFEWRLTEALDLPFWTAKLFVDVVPVVLSGVLSVLLAWRLTRNRFLAACSGLAMVGAPIFALASAEGLALVLFQPLFLGALLVLVRALQGGGRVRSFAAAGALLGLACLVRANPQFLLLALAPAVWWGLRRAGRARPVRVAALGLAVALATQALLLLPWSLLQRRLGTSGVFAAPVVYYAFFDGIRRHDGFEVSEALRRDPDPPPLSFEGVVEFHREWLARDPAALARLYAAKTVRTWYLSDSGRWNGWILVLHAPIWLLALAGAGLWLRAAPRDPALWLVLTTVLYLWAISASVSGLARYMAPVYGLLGLLAGVALLRARRAALAARGRP